MGRRDKVFDAATANAEALSNKVSVLHYFNKFIYIKNNHASNGIQYEVRAYADARDTTDSAYILQTWTILSAGEQIIHKTEDPWDQVYVAVKNESTGANASAVVWINCGGFERG